MSAAGDRPESGAAPQAARPHATVVDAGVGNLGNLERALRHLGATVEVTAEPARVAAARCLLLPGVGAFRPPREALRGALETAIRQALAGGSWLLGICVGYQLLFSASEEFGPTDGLGLLPGRVTRLPATVPLPHIGWNRLEPAAGAVDTAAAGLLAGLPAEPWVYFVHGFAPEGVPAERVAATALHGRRFAAVAGAGRVLGTQFHPEKSGETGLALLANYLRLASGRSFELLPALDLRRGEVVRLLRGDAGRATVYGDDPARVLAGFAAAGVRRAHLVDLDAAFGEAPQRALLERLAALPAGDRPELQLGGGLRDEAAVSWALAAGFERAILGSLAVREPRRFAELAGEHPGRLVPALDVRGDEVRTAGWRQGSALRPEEAAERLAGAPCPAVLVTDVERDGTLEGPNLALAERVAAAAGIPALVSGGVRSLADLAAARRAPGLAGAVVGRAFYEGRLRLDEALAVCGGRAA